MVAFYCMSVVNANSVDPDQTPRKAASDLSLHCLPISHLWDARHKWVENGVGYFLKWLAMQESKQSCLKVVFLSKMAENIPTVWNPLKSMTKTGVYYGRIILICFARVLQNCEKKILLWFCVRVNVVCRDSTCKWRTPSAYVGFPINIILFSSPEPKASGELIVC